MTELLQYLVSGIVVGCIYGLVAIGFTAVYNVTSIVNFAQGEASMLAALGAAGLIALGLPLLAALVLAVLGVGLLGIVIERVAIRPIGQDVMRGIIITIGVGIVLQGLAVLIWGTDAQPLPAFSGHEPIRLGDVAIPRQAVWVVGTTAVLMSLLYVFLTRTYLGKAFRACAMNSSAASLMGVPTLSMRRVGFFLSGLVGAIAGVIVAPIALMQYDSGLSLGIKGFVACIIGGFGNPIGAALGGLLLGVLEALSSGYLSSGFKNAIAFVLLLVFLLARPGGLLGELDAVKK
ncbi:branched-chain amino acid ABC transporter permease [Verticiella sediminum]|uniref:Branched-chain amino acid ABC transporter permease n=1 Tax=Verticiella sediminum TaxID=1247510 RepID=A0A556AIJ5_9BURK|nr:branched-chain amino acid ABC transporter permease [Verticiella sediminum]TSH92708.1 branched-chain amino acid ABC transporter permease [Verticiella sediminum]